MAHRSLPHKKDVTKLTIPRLEEWVRDLERFVPHSEKEVIGRNRNLITARYLIAYREANGLQ